MQPKRLPRSRYYRAPKRSKERRIKEIVKTFRAQGFIGKEVGQQLTSQATAGTPQGWTISRIERAYDECAHEAIVTVWYVPKS